MPIDFTQYGGTVQTTKTKPTPSGGIDFSQYGGTAKASTRQTQVPVPQAVQSASQQDNPLVSAGASVVGGLANAGANIASVIPTGINWALEKIGAINPDMKADMDAYIQEKKGLVTSEANSSGNIIERGMARNPGIAAVSQAVPEVYSAFKVPVPQMTKVPGAGLAVNAGKTLVNQATKAAINIPLAAGMAGSDQGTQDVSALLTAIAGPTLDIAGEGLKLLGRAPVVKAALKQYLNPINEKIKELNVSLNDRAAMAVSNLTNKIQQIEDDLWRPFSNVQAPVNSDPVVKQLTSLVNLKLPDKQIGTVNNMLEDALNAETMQDLIALKRKMGANFGEFTAKNASKTIHDKYTSIQDNLNTLLESKAKSLGLGEEWASANRWHRDIVVDLQKSKKAIPITKAVNDKQAAVQTDAPELYDATGYESLTGSLLESATKSPKAMKTLLSIMDESGSEIIGDYMIKQTLGDLTSNPMNFEKNVALYKINKIIEDYTGVLTPYTMQTFKGVQKVLKQSGAIGTTKLKDDVGILATIPQMKSMLMHIEEAFENPTMTKIFQGIAEGKPWAKQLGEALKLAPAAGAIKSGEYGDPNAPKGNI